MLMRGGTYAFSCHARFVLQDLASQEPVLSVLVVGVARDLWVAVPSVAESRESQIRCM